MTTCISVADVRKLYSTDIEFALIDPREEVLFARAHLFSATNMPLSRLELHISRAVPQLGTLIVLCDDGDGVAERAAKRLEQLGYENLRVLDGGVPAWSLSGGAVFSGVNVPSKAFGEFVEKALGTPSINADSLAEKIESGEKIMLLDARPSKAHKEYCIPDSIGCPSAELIYRTASSGVDDDTLVVVHCAGRTRSIIGAQTLIDAGKHQHVVSLENGTPAWEFAGLELEIGNHKILPPPDADTLKVAQEVGRKIRSEWNITVVEPDECLRPFREGRTRYVFDVRTEAEYLSGHIAGSNHVAGGQLLQTTERHIVVQNADVVLVDSDGVRATTTAMWLRRMGWQHLAVSTIGEGQNSLEVGATRNQYSDDLERISMDDAAREISEKRVVVCDIRCSVSFRRGHIANARFLSRADLVTDLSKISDADDILLMIDDVQYACLVAQDLQSAGRRVRLIDADFASWLQAGHPISKGVDGLVSRPVDTYLEGEHFDSQTIRDRENHAYLNWEIALIDHIVEDPAVRFIASPNC